MINFAKIRTAVLLLIALLLITSSVSASSNDIKKKPYSLSASRWSAALKNLSVKGTTSIWPYRKDGKHKNGFRDSIIFLPDSAHPEDLHLIVWFHGCGGFSSRTFKARILPQLKAVESKGYSAAIAIPEMPWSTNTKTRCGRQGRIFNRPSEFSSYLADVKVRLNKMLSKKYGPVKVNPKLVIFGHSAGGSTISSISKSGDLCREKPEFVVWSDSTYGRWFDSAWKSCLSSGVSTVVLLRKWNKPHEQFKRYFKNKKVPEFLNVQLYTGKITHTAIGDHALEFSGIFPEGC